MISFFRICRLSVILTLLLLAGCASAGTPQPATPVAATPTPELARDFTLTTLMARR
jgi:uncharacterized lipoprotein YajG